MPATREWWKIVWASPMATIWLDADVPALVRLANMIDLVNQGSTKGDVIRGIMALEDRFGLSPLSRRRLQWEVDQAGGDSSGSDVNDPNVVVDMERWARAARREPEDR
jgi:hypothetical protein